MVFPMVWLGDLVETYGTFGGKWTVVREYKGSSPLKGQVGSLLVMMISFWRGCVKNQHFVQRGISSQCILHIESCCFSTLYLFSGQLYCNHAFHSKCLVELCRIQCRQSLECPICRHKQPIRVQGEPILSTHRIPASQIAIAEITWDAEVAGVVHNRFGSVTAVVGADLTCFLFLHLKRCWMT